MSISPNDVLNKNKNLNKRISVDKINLKNVTIDDLQFNGKIIMNLLIYNLY